jgi:ATP-binding cassette subfamily G (WHITE) protein 2 (SNQ2)
MWRNLGIVLALWIFFVVLLMINIERLPAAGSNKAVLLYKRGGGGKFIRASAKGGEGDAEEGQEEREVVEKPGRSGKGEKEGGKKSEKGEKGREQEDESQVHATDT